MSSQPEAKATAAPAPKEPVSKEEKQQQRKSLTKLLSRAKTALRRGEGSSRRKEEGATKKA